MARRNPLDDFTCRRIIQKLEEWYNLTSVWEVFCINKIVVSRASKAFQTISTTVSGRPWKVTAVDDRYIVLQGKGHRYR
ncbi:hypothetical protein TNCV_433701 [Trichonephila clavipes]|nr:hypothetical protein TNCV_433701 [Trichonephila clavipes]